MWNLRLILLLLCIVTTAYSQYLLSSVAFDFSTPSSAFFPPILDENYTCSTYTKTHRYKTLNFGSSFGDYYEVVVASSGPQPISVGVYSEDFSPYYPCDYYDPLGNDIRPYGMSEPAVDTFTYLDQDCTLIVFIHPPPNSSVWNQTVVVNIYTTFAWGIGSRKSFMNETIFSNNINETQCQVTNESVPYMSYTWTQATSGLFDIYGAFEDNDFGFSLGLYSGAASSVLPNPCTSFIAGDNIGDLGPAIYGVTLQRAVYTLVISGYPSNVPIWEYFVIQVANSKFLTNAQTGFTQPDANSSVCEPSTTLNNTYWVSFETDNLNYANNILYTLFTATYGWSIFVYSGNNIGSHSSPPQTCTTNGLVAFSLDGSNPLSVIASPSQILSFVITSSQNADTTTDTQPLLYFLQGALPVTTSTSGRPVSTTNRITTGNTSSNSVTTGGTIYSGITISPPPPVTATTFHFTTSGSVLHRVSIALALILVAMWAFIGL